MNHATTIRTELERFIEREALSFSQLGRLAGLNAGTVSSILKGNRIMGVDQLDRMTAVLGLPKGHFYEQYIQECMVEAVPNWRRVRPFLYRCAELDKLDCIKRILPLLLDNLTYSPLLFETAEEFFVEGRRAAAVLIYESVALSERRQHSERLAFCQYRLFTLRLSDNQEDNLQCALQFEPFVDRLDEIDQLDALRDLANTYRSLRRWDKVEPIAEEMERLARIQLFTIPQPARAKREQPKKPKKPMFVYLAFSYLLRGSVCDSRNDYEQGIQYTYAYEDLSWVKETDEDTLHWLKLYKGWAQANIYVSKLMRGDESVLADYVFYIEQNKDELLVGLLNITEAANLFDLNVDHILQYFNSEINGYMQIKYQEAVGVYTKQVVSEQHARFLYGVALYYLKQSLYQIGFEYLLSSLFTSSLINNETRILACVRLFERYRAFAPHEIQHRYQNLLKEEEEEHEKKIGISIGRS
ncbi:DNA-binding protein [Paenibacillus helianthi]|uniref:DNA-binding protein n=1 Tax=Paenibacillus helianthi TaxID=1349432 RepID=A0ABX3EJQ0_9BACL|nr:MULTISPECIES: helix-turn-helix transcriptional regulator [Paenibacillus]OKP73148.1 DNA-binding protein [Paenibacillus sp. P3E]OKP82863.1 DNA-binding protein [Paenibacillus helianthi]